MRALVIVLLFPLAGCAALLQQAPPRPQAVLERGLAAYDRQEFQAAYDDVSWVYSNFWNTRIGERALLTLSAIELDPRNPGRRLIAGAELASAYPGLPHASSPSVPVSHTLEALAREVSFANDEIARLDAENALLGDQLVAARAEAASAARAAQEARADAVAAREAARRAQAAARTAAAAAAASPVAPTPQPAAPVGVTALQAERDRLSAEVQQLRRESAERERELERIRQTIIPR
jgi:hypothetical protein